MKRRISWRPPTISVARNICMLAAFVGMAPRSALHQEKMRLSFPASPAKNRRGKRTVAVTAKEQMRAKLVHCAGNDGGLRRDARPAVIAQHAAPQATHGQRAFAPGQSTQIKQSLGDSANGGGVEDFQEAFAILSARSKASSTTMRRSTTNQIRRALLRLRVVRLRGECKHGDVEARGLSALRGQVNRIGPAPSGGAFGKHPCQEKGFFFPPQIAEEICEPGNAPMIPPPLDGKARSHDTAPRR